MNYSPERHYSSLAPPPLRSALKHSRPSSPAPPPGSPVLRYQSPLLAASPPPGPSRSLSHTPVSHTGSLSPGPVVAQQGYTPKVGFDTFENPQASMFSYTLHVQSDGYTRSKNTRVFLCAASPDESGTQALEWVLENLVQDGDELIVFRGADSDDLDKEQDVYREEARELMRQVQDKCVEYDADRKLSIIIEFIAGNVPGSIDRLIALYRPDSLVVGTRGQRGMLQTWGAALGGTGVGSVSKYCLSHSPVPIIVVRPESKVRKVLAKRKADPKRGKHFDELGKNGRQSVPMFSALTR
ncbi:hypothetical protein EIP86_009347 [Pleurotus ostreatoroseus]|nr:hypothetical protein EIP86_009347 [Pleurotus ostreatoroseus]